MLAPKPRVRPDSGLSIPCAKRPWGLFMTGCNAGLMIPQPFDAGEVELAEAVKIVMAVAFCFVHLLQRWKTEGSRMGFSLFAGGARRRRPLLYAGGWKFIYRA